MDLSDMPEPDCRRILGHVRKVLGDDAALNSALIRAALNPPIDIVGWLMAIKSHAMAEEGATEGGPDLGPTFSACRTRPRPWLGKIGRIEASTGRWVAGAFYLDGAENAVLEVMGLPFDWPGDTRPLAQALADGADLHDDILRPLKFMVRRTGWHPPDRSLAMIATLTAKRRAR